MAPRQLCNNLLHEAPIGVCLGESPHVFQVAGREAGHPGEIVPEILRETIDDASPPTLRCLPFQYVAADAPVEQDELLIDAHGRPQARRADAVLELGQKRRVGVSGRS